MFESVKNTGFIKVTFLFIAFSLLISSCASFGDLKPSEKSRKIKELARKRENEKRLKAIQYNHVAKLGEKNISKGRYMSNFRYMQGRWGKTYFYRIMSIYLAALADADMDRDVRQLVGVNHLNAMYRLCGPELKRDSPEIYRKMQKKFK